MGQSLRQAAVAVLITVFIAFSPHNVLGAPILTQFGGNKALVPNGQSLETLVTVNTDAHIAGSVSDVVLVINGDIYLEPTAKVDLVIDLGGHVSNQSKNIIRQGILELDLTQPVLNNLFLAGVMLLGTWFIRFLLSIFAIILLTLLSFFLSGRVSRSDSILQSAGIRLFGIGTVAALVITALAVLVALTVIGIPLAFLVLLLGILGATLGTLPIITLGGNKLLSPSLSRFPALTRALINSTLFVSLINLPFIGALITLGVGLTGLGLTLTRLWMYLYRRRPAA